VVAPFYGGIPRDAGALKGICPAVGGWGRTDLIYGGHGDRLADHLDALGMPHEFKTYDNVGHSFMNNHQTFAFKKLGGGITNARQVRCHGGVGQLAERVLVFFKRVFSGELKAQG
jgi:carboxymethylenebutenolidase